MKIERFRIHYGLSCSLALAVLAGCSSGAAKLAPPAAQQYSREAAHARPAGFSLHPPRIHFTSPQEHYKVEHVRGFGVDGAIGENCIKKGAAEVAGDGLHGNTLIAIVIPMAPGRCTATFTNGTGAKLTLPVTVGT